MCTCACMLGTHASLCLACTVCDAQGVYAAWDTHHILHLGLASAHWWCYMLLWHGRKETPTFLRCKFCQVKSVQSGQTMLLVVLLIVPSPNPCEQLGHCVWSIRCHWQSDFWGCAQGKMAVSQVPMMFVPIECVSSIAECQNVFQRAVYAAARCGCCCVPVVAAALPLHCKTDIVVVDVAVTSKFLLMLMLHQSQCWRGCVGSCCCCMPCLHVSQWLIHSCMSISAL